MHNAILFNLIRKEEIPEGSWSCWISRRTRTRLKGLIRKEESGNKERNNEQPNEREAVSSERVSILILFYF